MRLNVGHAALQGLWTIISFPSKQSHPKVKEILKLNSLIYTRHSGAIIKNEVMKPMS